MKKLIVRVDDLGMSEGVNLGCLAALRKGTAKSVGLMVNLNAAEQAVEMLQGMNDVCLGVHINLVEGKPCSPEKEVRDLLQENGLFITHDERRTLIRSGVDTYDYPATQIEVEAQVKEFIRMTGKTPDYMDIHCSPTHGLERAMMVVAEKYGIRMVADLAPMPWRVIGRNPSQYDFYETGRPPVEYLKERAMHLEDGETGLLVMHPAFLDNHLVANSGLTYERMSDYDLVVSEEMRQYAEKEGIVFISFNDLD